MNIQIFGSTKCFDTKKAQRYFKERRIRFQDIDMRRFGMSRGEFNAVLRAVGVEELADPKARDYDILRYLAHDEDRIEKLFENQQMIRTPVVRNGRQCTVGYRPDIWDTWE